MARRIKRAVVAVAVALGPLVAAVPAHTFIAENRELGKVLGVVKQRNAAAPSGFLANHNQALVEDEG